MPLWSLFASIGLGATGTLFVLWRKAILQGKLDFLQEHCQMLQGEIKLTREALAQSDERLSTELAKARVEIQTLQTQRKAALDALASANVPGALRGLLRASLGVTYPEPLDPFKAP